MKYESWNIAVEGQKTGEAVLHGYLLDAISVAPEKKRPAVIVCAGGGYARRSDREAEPVILQFLSMGYHGFLLDYSAANSMTLSTAVFKPSAFLPPAVAK